MGQDLKSRSIEARFFKTGDQGDRLSAAPPPPGPRARLLLTELLASMLGIQGDQLTIPLTDWNPGYIQRKQIIRCAGPMAT